MFYALKTARLWWSIGYSAIGPISFKKILLSAAHQPLPFISSEALTLALFCQVFKSAANRCADICCSLLCYAIIAFVTLSSIKAIIA